MLVVNNPAAWVEPPEHEEGGLNNSAGAVTALPGHSGGDYGGGGGSGANESEGAEQAPTGVGSEAVAAAAVWPGRYCSPRHRRMLLTTS